MKTAIFFTGQMRSLARTSALLRKNLIEPNDVVLFAAVESHESPASVAASLLANLGPIIIGGLLVQPTFRTPEFQTILQLVANRPATPPEVMGYLSSSGSILQYYQLWKAWDLLLHYEKTSGIRFDMCVRARFDLLLTERIRVTDHPLDTTRIQALREQGRAFESSSYYDGPSTEKDCTVWTLGCEQVWFARRDLFAQLASMVFQYGRWLNPNCAGPHSSEAFFHEFCKAQGWAHVGFQELGNPIFNTDHPGDSVVTDDPWVFSLLR